jgi:hypothetical protein
MRLFLGGCALASLLGVALLVVTGWWFMDAIGFMGLPLFPFGDRWTITRALTAANANRFAVPADHALGEDRLRKFLKTRQAMFAVYERYRPAILTSARKTWPEPRTPAENAAGVWIWQVTKAYARQLAEERMSEAEYYFIRVTLLDLCGADDSETSRRARVLLRGQFSYSGLPTRNPLPELPVAFLWPPAVREANLALALRHRDEIAAYDEIEEAWGLGMNGKASLRAPCWSQVASRSYQPPRCA